MKEAICNKCKFVYFSNEIPKVLECFCGSKNFKIADVVKVKPEINVEEVKEGAEEVSGEIN